MLAEENTTNRSAVLYIDDEEMSLKYFRMAFSNKFTVFTAPSGREGLDILEAHGDQIAVVVSDQRMPVEQGSAVLGRIRDQYPQIVRILTTAYSDLDSAIDAVNRGHIYQYVVKPWDLAQFGIVLQRAADYHNILSERNALLALKMTMLQRILCTDRVKWLMLAARASGSHNEAAVGKALLAMLELVRGVGFSGTRGGSDAFSPQAFQFSTVMDREFRTGERLLEWIVKAKAGPLDSFAAKVADVVGGSLECDNETIERQGNDVRMFMSVDARQGTSGEILRRLCGVLTAIDPDPAAEAFFALLVAVLSESGSLTLDINGDEVRIDGPPGPVDFGSIITELEQAFDLEDVSSLSKPGAKFVRDSE